MQIIVANGCPQAASKEKPKVWRLLSKQHLYSSACPRKESYGWFQARPPKSPVGVFLLLKASRGCPLVAHGFHTALRRANIHGFRFHDLRHTFASQLVMSGIDLVSVKELLGHKSLTMTMRYSHLSPGHKRKAVHVLDRLMEENENDVSKKWYKNGTIAEGETSLVCPKSLGEMVRPVGVEPTTH